MVKVARIHPGSIAEELGILPGTQLLTVNGRALDDFLDWEFLTAEDTLEIEATLPDGERVVYDIERPENESMGLELEPPTVRRCANRCEFCFVEGLPKGLRRPLYIRDDDYRLSFAYGNFATLSNVKERDIARILEYRLSPLYVSVHATPWEARKMLLNNPRVPNILEQLKRLAAGGIQFHGQMVIVPGLNDGDVLEESLADLWSDGRRRADRCARAGGAHAVLPSLHRRVDGRGKRIADPRDGGEVGRAQPEGTRLHLGLRLRRAVPARGARTAAALVLRRLPADRERRRRGDRRCASAWPPASRDFRGSTARRSES